MDPEARGSGESHRGCHGSDQSIFTRLLGEQEFQREVIRLKYLPWWDRLFHTSASRPRH